MTGRLVEVKKTEVLSHFSDVNNITFLEAFFIIDSVEENK
jgi:hypothetical protein